MSLHIRPIVSLSQFIFFQFPSFPQQYRISRTYYRSKGIIEIIICEWQSVNYDGVDNTCNSILMRYLEIGGGGGWHNRPVPPYF